MSAEVSLGVITSADHKRDVYSVSNDAFTAALNSPFSIGARMDKEHRAIYDRVRAQMVKLKMSWPGGLADALGVDHQVVNNWRTRRIPPAMHERVAAALGWSVDQLLGTKQSDDRDAWPFPNIPEHRYRRLTDSQRLIVEAAMLEALDAIEGGQSPPGRHRRRPRPSHPKAA